MSDSPLLSSLLDKLHKVEDSILAILLFGMIVLASSQIFLRNLFDSGLVWADPLLRIMVLWIGLLGALAATRENKHIRIDLLKRFLSVKMRVIVKIFNNLFASVITALLAYHSIRFVIMEYEAKSEVLMNIPAWMMESILPVAFALMSVRFVIHFIIGIKILKSGRYEG